MTIRELIAHFEQRLSVGLHTSPKDQEAIEAALDILRDLPAEDDPFATVDLVKCATFTENAPPPGTMLRVEKQTYLNALREVDELRKRRDDLIAANNLLVEQRRMAEERARLAEQTAGVLLRSLSQRADQSAAWQERAEKAEAALHDAEAAIRFDAAAHDPRPMEEYHEDMGPVLWWMFPVVETPYYGTPRDLGWQYEPGRRVGGFPDYVTHFTLGPDRHRVQHRWEEIKRNYTVDVRRREAGDADE